MGECVDTCHSLVLGVYTDKTTLESCWQNLLKLSVHMSWDSANSLPYVYLTEILHVSQWWKNGHFTIILNNEQCERKTGATPAFFWQWDGTAEV